MSRALRRVAFLGVVLSIGCGDPSNGLQIAPDSIAAQAAPVSPSPPDLGTSRRTAIVDAVARVGPSVVSISVTSRRRASSRSLFDNWFLPRRSERLVQGYGTGFIIRADGLIITNHHVIEGATAVKVVLSDGRVYDAEIVGSDPITDVGVLELETTDLVPLALGAADTLTVGMPAIAVGSPLGLDGGPSLSVGVISALGREVQTGPEVVLFGMIQTDAPITNGSSGGALVDSNGKLIGITTAIGASQLGIEGIGFATPIEIVERVANEIIDTGSASHALLGILGSTSYESIADSGVMPVGVTVEEVTESSSAAVAEIAVGQVITSVDGVPVRTMDELITALRHYSAGETVTVQLTDGGTVTLELGARE